jgi:hypothetical protein
MESACMAKGFLPYSLDQRLLLAPDMRAWLADGHLALFVSDVVDALDLSAIFAAYVKTSNRGRAGYHPARMVKLLVYGYAIGVTSSRKLEQKSFVQRVQRPDRGRWARADHRCRRRHANAERQATTRADGGVGSRDVGRLAEVTSADAGYFSERAVERAVAMGTELLVPHGKSTERRSRCSRRCRPMRPSLSACATSFRVILAEPFTSRAKQSRNRCLVSSTCAPSFSSWR